MAAIADLVVFKNDGVTNVTYVAKVPSAGDKSPAMWRFDAHPAPYIGLKPEVRMMSMWNGPKTGRRISIDFTYQGFVTDTTTTIASSLAKVPLSLTGLIPVNLPQADIDEAVAQFSNILKSVLLQSSMKLGYSPT